jgi:gluconate kinase
MPSIFLLFGVPGSGKTFLGRQLAQKHNFLFYDSDTDFSPEVRQQVVVDQENLLDFYTQVIRKIDQMLKGSQSIVVASALGKDRYRQLFSEHFAGQLKFVLIVPSSDKHLTHTAIREKLTTDLEMKNLSDHLKQKIFSFEPPSFPCLRINNDYSSAMLPILEEKLGLSSINN